ncbi:hypothetical protein G4B88_028214 [Cannabis sativa]|uniref:Endonuclease/exonuclease/phosphatase domain-containing protein n=1 Tax=Cannabis sativa TaxID=3483 RepID=A0A7J6DQD5_CANSA|nr:hypothetical protein G4B88_028214 [Cannabis sativa]
MGDFNSFLSYDDKEGSTYYDNRDMDAFLNFLAKFHLSPLPFVGNKFTWKNSSVREHLDWAIISDSWSDLFPDVVLHHLPFFGSDHRALKLILKDNSFNSPSRRSRRFLFENVWLENPEFFSLVKDTWDCGLSSQSSRSSFQRSVYFCSSDLE